MLTKTIIGECRLTITGRDQNNHPGDSVVKWKHVFSEPRVKLLIAYLRLLVSKEHDLMESAA
jgi:hypothetical protein